MCRPIWPCGIRLLDIIQTLDKLVTEQYHVPPSQKRTGYHYGILAIATWATWFWVAQGLLLPERRQGT